MQLAKPIIQRFEPRRLGDKPWGEEWLIIETSVYIGKRLNMQAGKGGALQFHREKDEAFLLHSGDAWVRYEDAAGSLCSVRMFPGQMFHVPPGAVHQVEAITDCVFYEWSTPVFDDRVRVGQ